MTSTTAMILRSRNASWATLSTLLACASAAAIGRYAIELDLSSRFPPTKLVIVELCVILAATLVAILTRPQFWDWDRTSTTSRPRVVAATTAAAGIALPSLCVPAVVPWLPDDTTWMWVLANAVMLSSTVQLLGPLLTPLLAGTATTALWFTAGLVANLAPHVWLPLTTYRAPTGEWPTAALLATAALVLHTATCGVTAWTHRRLA